MPRVSVNIVVYNGERYIGDAIASVLEQSFEDFEIVVVDDGSSDGTLEVIRAFSDPRLKCYSNGVNRGLWYSRNRVLNLSIGEYVAVLDADDEACCERLAQQVKFFESNPDIVLVGGGYEEIDSSGKCLNVVMKSDGFRVIEWGLFFGNPIAHSTVMYRREAALLAGGYGNLVFAEDLDLWIRMTAFGGFINLPDILSRYRIHSNGVTQLSASNLKRDCVARILAKGFQNRAGMTVERDVAKLLAFGADSVEGHPDCLSSILVLEECVSAFLSSREIAFQERSVMLLDAVGRALRILGSEKGEWRRLLGGLTISRMVIRHFTLVPPMLAKLVRRSHLGMLLTRFHGESLAV